MVWRIVEGVAGDDGAAVDVGREDEGELFDVAHRSTEKGKSCQVCLDLKFEFAFTLSRVLCLELTG